MTQLYNTKTKEFISKIFPNGYYVDGKKPILPEDIVELEIVDTTVPEVPDNKKLITSRIIDLENNTYTNSYNVVNLTKKEIKDKNNYIASIADSELDAKLIKEFIRGSISNIDEILKYKSIYPYYKIGVNYKVGDMFRYKGDLFRVIMDHESSPDLDLHSSNTIYELL